MAQTRRSKSILAACCGAHVVQDGLGAALYVLMPILAQVFGLSYAQVGMIRAANNCASSIMELPSGVLAERLGESRLLVFGLICACAGYLCLSVSTGVWTVFASLLLLGTGAGFQHALSSSLISRTTGEPGRRAALGIYNSSGDVGKLAFAGLFGLATGIGIAWQGVVVALALVALVAAIAVFFTLRGTDVAVTHSSTSHQGAVSMRGDWGFRDRKEVMALCVSVFLDTAVQSGFLVFVAFVIAEKGVSVHVSAFAVVLTLVGGIVGKFGCGFLAQRIGVRASFFLTQGATALTIMALTISSPVAAFLLLPLLGMFLQGSTTITYGAVSDVVRSDRQSRGFALIYTVSSLSAIAGPTIFGVLGDRFGLDAAMLAMALVSLLAIPPLMVMRTGIEDTALP
ncbi:MAG: MFS transporter [Pseudomonadota bacterium]